MNADGSAIGDSDRGWGTQRGAGAGPSGSRNRSARFGGWNSDEPPGLTATPNGGGGSCGTRRGSGAAVPGPPAADPPCSPTSPAPLLATP